MPKRTRGDDCLRQCLARLLGRPVHRVPHFVRQHKGRWSWHLARWCDRTGHAMFMVPVSKRTLWNNERSGPWIAIGPTRRTRRTGDHHATLVSNDGVLWDGGIPLVRADRLLFIIPKRDHAMPYTVRKVKGGHKVFKKGTRKAMSRKPMSKAKAERQRRALYANERR